jgi:hypothetical protein
VQLNTYTNSENELKFSISTKKIPIVLFSCPKSHERLSCPAIGEKLATPNGTP